MNTLCSGRTGQALVHELDHGGALADRGRAALDRAGAHVAGRVDPWHARLEQALGAEFYPWYDASYMMIGQYSVSQWKGLYSGGISYPGDGWT